MLMWMASSLGTFSASAKNGLSVVDDGNCLKVSLVWPRTLTDENVIA